METGPLAWMEMGGKKSNKVKMKSVRRNAGSRQACFFMQRSDKGHLKANCCHGWATHRVDWKRLQLACSRTQRQRPAYPSRLGWQLCQPVGAGYDLPMHNQPTLEKGGRAPWGGFLKVLACWRAGEGDATAAGHLFRRTGSDTSPGVFLGEMLRAELWAMSVKTR